MPTPTDNSNWFWSQQGVTLGPIDLEEIRRLASAGTIQPSTYVYDPARAAWVLAGSVDGLFPTGPASPPPDAPRSPGAASAGFASSDAPRSAPPAMSTAPAASTLDPLKFIHVRGQSSRTGQPRIVPCATSPWNRDRRGGEPARRATISRVSKPTLCRVPS